MNTVSRRLALFSLALFFVCFSGGARAQSATPQASGESVTPSPTAQPTASPAATTATVASTTTPPANAPAPKADGADAPVVKKVGNVVLPPEKSQPTRIPKFDAVPVIDGKLDDAVWKQAAVLKDFYQIDPGDNSAPSKPTEVMIGYDAKTLYIAFHAYDEPDKVRATTPRRDQIFQDDYVGFFLDTFNDQRRAYCIFFSPLGVQADGILTDGRGEDYSVDIVMESKGTITADGFIVEVAIPFKSLRYEAGKDKLWGAHFLRRIKRISNELDSWMPFSRDVTGNLNQAGKLTGLEGIATERTIEVIPSLTVQETGRRYRTISRAQRHRLNQIGLNPLDNGTFINEPLDLDAGVTAKFGISPQLTLDLAVNPDFAQVEADQLVVTANQRFPIFFAERRPFFLEGKEIFETRIQTVHTRAIVDPDIAVKLTGKQGRNTFGLLYASDNAPGNLSFDDRRFISETEDLSFEPDPARRAALAAQRGPLFNILDKNANFGIVRVKRDVGKQSHIGFIGTANSFVDERYNYLGGFDGRFKLTNKVTAEFQVLGTNSKNVFFDPADNRFEKRVGSAFAYSGEVEYSGRNLYVELSTAGRTRFYRSDVGFFQRTNTNSQGLFVGWFSTPKEKRTLRSWGLYSYSHINYDWQGRMQVWESEYHLELSMTKQSYFNIGYEFGYERLFEEEFGPRGRTFAGDNERSSNKNHFFLSFNRTPSKKYAYSVYTNYRAGHLDLDFGSGRKFPRVSPSALAGSSVQDPGRGGLLEMGGSFTYQPTSAMRNTLSLTKNRLARYDTGRVSFDDNILSLRSQYQFTKFLAARARVDYTTLSQRLAGQFLFGWTPSPGTAFYAGYNDNMNYHWYNPYSALRETGFNRNERTFFIKMSYLFRKSL